MAVRDGYQQTEIGVIPEDWRVKRLNQISSPVRGGSPRPAGDPRFFNGSFIPWLTVSSLTNISESKITVTRASGCLTEEGSLRSRVLNPGTLIIANSGATLGVAKILGIKCCANDGVAALLRLDKLADTKYLVYYFNTLTASLRETIATGNGQPNLNTALIGNIQVSFPPTKAEQESIAEALSDADGLIESLGQLIAKKRQVKQGAMQELLRGKRRLPGFEGKWEEKKLGQLFDFSGGVTASREQLGSEGHCYLHYGDIHASDKMFIDVGREFPDIPKLRVPLNRVSKASLLNDGDIVFVDASEDDEGVSRHVVVINPDGVPFISGLHTIVAKSKTEDLTHSYRQYCFQAEKVKDQFRFYAAGAKVIGVSKRNIKQIKITFPRRDEQAAIATILSDMDAEIASLEAKLAKARKVKQGMMQDLLTGSIRLPLAQGCSEAKKSAKKPRHNRHFEDAAIIGTLVDMFGRGQFPLGRKRYTKLSYLLHRFQEQDTSAYLKKAAGPYNPTTRYGGAEKIAIKNQYVRQAEGQYKSQYKGFVPGENAGQAQEYFLKWYGPEALQWLEQFRYAKTDDLELWATIDAAIQDVRAEGQAETLENVKAVLQGDKEWVKKLARPVFSDENIVAAMGKVDDLFKQAH